IGDALLFPDENFAHVTYDGVFGGYIWSEYTGWIKLSSDTFDPGVAQSSTNWGVYMDADEPDAAPLESPFCTGKDETACGLVPDICEWTTECVPVPLDIGHHLYGYAWSENLGWIQFSQDDFNFGVYTTWIPDQTPPELLAINESWFANNSDIGTVIWENFATDPESGIDLDETILTLTAHSSSDFAGCTADTIVNDIEGDDLNLTLIQAGDLMTVDVGFCAYEITGDVVNGAGLTTSIVDPIIFYVRAGVVDLTNTSIDSSGAATAIADGKDIIEYVFEPMDILGNPIVPVKVKIDEVNFNGENNVIEEGDSNLWVRSVVADFNMQANNFNFDSVNTAISPTSIPARLDDIDASSGGLLYDNTADLGDGVHLVFTLEDVVVNTYPVQVVAYAPTNCGGCSSQEFIMDEIIFTTDDLELPSVAAGVVETLAAETEYIIDNTTALLGGNPLNASYDFGPALITSNGVIDQNPLIVGVPANASFDFSNVSTLDSITGLAVDNYMNFENGGGGIGSQVLDIRDIDSSDAAGDGETGRGDPIVSGSPRYALGYGIGNAQSSAFHSDSINRHSSSYSFDFDFDTSTTLDAIGSYDTDGIWDLPLDADLEELDYTDTPIDPPITIDRGDLFNVLTNLAIGASSPVTIGFTPIQWIGEGFTTDVTYNLDQYIAYRMQDSPFDSSVYAVYEPSRTIEDVGVKNIGVQASGIVTGENVYETVGGRDLESITSTGSSELRRQIRNNVADLTRNIEPCTITGTTILANLPDSDGGCVKVDNNTDTIIAVYEGDFSNGADILQIGNGVDIEIPDGYKYTIITKGGISLFIRNNIAHGTGTSFGMIVLEDENGDGGNTYVHYEPTNIVGLLYTEGSLLSSPDGSTLYYGSGAANSVDLKNQLYWQGSIVSRNTIGGAPNRIYPDGVDCFGQAAPICSQIYDMDYIRRFTVRDGSGFGYISAGTYFSGGGECTAGLGTCVYGGGATTITLTGVPGDIDMSNSKSIDPFYIEKDNKPAPPGFTAGGGFEQGVEIR
ncbi:hypothetical protein KKA95_01850, partial [Patescibacteria group bacterium]|nr:hypothetical protein [Patescibacteria group bacterium]